ncbi:MAG: TnpV protein [Lachnospiraceae bacterium]|nr:TnpV protein [Lachnospiraceae bacterium]
MKREPLTKLEYRMGEDGMLYPNLLLSKNLEYDRIPVGIFGRSWKEYMKEKHPMRLSELIALGKINEMITKVDQEAEEKKEALIQKLLEVQPLPQTEDTLKRAGHMEMLTRQAEEIIFQEVVYQLR